MVYFEKIFPNYVLVLTIRPKNVPVFPLTRPTLLFRADPAIVIAILKNKIIYSPTDPFFA